LGHTEIVKFLLKESNIISSLEPLSIGVNIDKRDSSGCNALFYAIKYGFEEIAFVLYCKGSSVGAP
jgi:ankyrin repeat protein